MDQMMAEKVKLTEAQRRVPVAARRRWGDNDLHVGPLTFAFRESWRPFALVVSSGSVERENPGCNVRFQAFGATMICELPQIIKPWRRWVDLTGREWANSAGYWDEHPREYGFSLSDGFFHLCLGAQTMDSSTTQDWSCFLPWTQRRQVAHRLYNADGSFAGDAAGLSWEEHRTLIATVTRVPFVIIDCDGERIDVETYIEEREWKLGTGWFRWLGFVAPIKRRRSLDISFKSEVGPEKGSWKGGVIGTGIDMTPGETHEQAFRRFCGKEHRSKSRPYRVTFAGRRALQSEGGET